MDRRWGLVSGIGLGAALMYLLDPERGKRRRALVRDKTVHALHETEDTVRGAALHLGHRARGLAARMRSQCSSVEVSDEVLSERVRSKLGHTVSHPRSLSVNASQGCVTLAGPILARDVDRLLKAVRSVRGVTGVENRLEVHEAAGNVPGLQGSTSQA
jgi:osmotically-inducible protein OsmY